MFESMGGMDQAFSRNGGGRPLRLRKTLGQQAAFWATNGLVMPLILVCYLVVSAEGLRSMMGVFSTRLYKLPVPGAGMLRNFDGWDRLDLAIVMAMLLFISITWLWYRLLKALMDGGAINELREKSPVLFYLLASICGVILLGDAALFYFGLAAKASGGWSETPPYVPLLATILYMAGLAGVGAWHADYHTSGTV